MEHSFSELDKLLLHTLLSTLQAQQTQTIQADISYLYDLGYSEDEIANSLDKLQNLDPATALKEFWRTEITCH